MNIFQKRSAMLLIILAFSGIRAAAQSRFQDPETGKWGYQDTEWNVLAPAIYDEVQPNFDTIMAVKKDGKMAALDQFGHFRIPLIYEQIMPNLNPFPSQFGYAAVTKNSKITNTWGMVDARGKVILPEKFQYVRAITPDLLVGRVDGDSMLQFFNLRGQPQFQIAGKNVEPGQLDNTTFSAKMPHGGKVRHFKLDGTLVYPKDPYKGVWTDGERTILWELNKTGMVDSKGKTVIPFEFFKISHGLPGQFICEKRDEKYVFESACVYDQNGKLVIPAGKFGVRVFGQVYWIQDEATGKCGVYDAKGAEILPRNYHFSSTRIYDEYLKIPEMHPEWYIYVQDLAAPNSNFLVRKDGKVIRPKGSISVQYHSEIHPLLIEMKPAAEGKSGMKTLIDFSGKKLLPAEYFSLDFTANPRIVIARKEMMSKAGFLNLDAPAATEFKFEYLQRLKSGYYFGQNLSDFELFTPDFKSIFKGRFLNFGEPGKEFFELFRADKNTSGRLVAVGRYVGANFNEWTGVNHEGKTFSLKKIMDGQPEKVEVEKVEPAPQIELIEDLILEEAPGVGSDAPSLPTQPAGDEVFTIVEKKPEFPGGEAEMLKFMAVNLKYPAIARENGIEGRVILSFIVEKDGSLSDIKILRDIGGGCGQEAMQLARAMPKWVPGQQRGQSVRVKYTLPVTFKLN